MPTSRPKGARQRGPPAEVAPSHPANPSPVRMQPWEANIEQALREADAIVDVRSPGEFAKGAVAGALNVPLFSSDERAEIGTLYKLLGKQEAIGKGLDVLGGRLREFVHAFEPYREGRLLVYCARGGMRSSAVVGLLGALGYDVQQLPGGYKAFRNYALSTFEQRLPPHLRVIHGRTGVGKTLLLQRLDNALDLEALAQHRSSLFGWVNLEPRTQQWFESELLTALGRLNPARPVWLEGESRKIGTVLMPDSLRKAMQAAPCVLVTAPLEVRIERIVAEYAREDPATIEQLVQALNSLRAFFGRERTDALAAQIRAGDYEPVVEVLLREYYDPRYDHAMRGYRFAMELDSTDLDAAAAALARFARDSGASGAEEHAEAGDKGPAAKKPLHLSTGSS